MTAALLFRKKVVSLQQKHFQSIKAKDYVQINKAR